jgi:hypothetical protein
MPPSVDEMMGDLQQADAAGDTQLAQHIAGLIKAQQNPNGAIAGEQDLGSVGNAALAFGVHEIHEIPVIGDLGLAAGRWAKQNLSGQPTTWHDAAQQTQAVINSAQQEHPVASTLGGAAGGLAGAVAGGEALDAVSGGRLALKAGEPVANAARLAAGGAALGGAQAGGEQAVQGNWGNVVPAAAGGAAAGAVLGPATGIAGRVGQAVARRVVPNLDATTARTLAKVFGENPSDLQAAWQAHYDATGRAPLMAELADYKQAGAIQGLAKGSNPIAASLQQAAEDAAAARSANMQSGFRADGAASPETLGNIRTQQGDLDYPAARQFTFSIPTEESAALGGVSPSDHIAGEILPQAGLGRADKVRIMSDLQNGQLSGQDAQLIRSGLSESLSRNYSPAVKGYLTDFDDILGTGHAPGSVVDPNAPPAGNAAAKAALDQANANYTANSNRVAGAEHGSGILSADTPDAYAATATAKPNANPNFQAGMHLGANDTLATASATPQAATNLAQRFATDDNLYQKVATTFGPDTADSLRRMGAAESASAKAMAPYRGAPSPDDNDSTLKDAVYVASAIASHGTFWKLYHGAKVFAGLDMPPNVEAKVAEYLTDPTMAPAGIRLLAKAGASASRLRQITMTAAGAAAILSGDSVADHTPENTQ